jgi:hypothetical protein
MNQYHGSPIITFIAAWFFVCAIVIVIDRNSIAQTHDDLHSTDSSLDQERVPPDDSDSVPISDPAADARTVDARNVAKLSQDTPTLLVGKVLDLEDRAIPKAIVTLSEADGTKHTTTSDSFGNFRFDQVFGGQQIVLSADASRHSFSDLQVGISGQTFVSWRAAAK